MYFDNTWLTYFLLLAILAVFLLIVVNLILMVTYARELLKLRKRARDLQIENKRLELEDQRLSGLKVRLQGASALNIFHH